MKLLLPIQNITVGLFRLFSSVTSKIIVVCVVIISLIAGMVSNIVFENIKTTVIAEKTNDLFKALDYQEQKLAHEFSITERTVQTVASDPEILKFLEGERVTLYENALSHLKSYNATKRYESLYILDETGLAVIATNPTFEGNNYGFRDYFTQSRSDKVFITTALGITTDSMGYYFSYPIYSQEDQKKLLGVVVIKVGEENIREMFFEQQNWDTYLLDSEGVIVFATNKSAVLKSLVPVPKLNELIGKKESQYLGKEIVSLGREKDWNRIRVSEESITFEALDLVEYDLQSTFFAKRIDQVDYYLLVSATQKSILNPAMQLARTAVWQIMVAATIALLSIGLTVYWILLPLKKVKLFAESISRGDYQSTLEVNTSDEFEEMTNSLINMQKKVKQDFANIAKNVDESQALSQKRVTELEKLNDIMVNQEIELVKLRNQLKEKEQGEKK